MLWSSGTGRKAPVPVATITCTLLPNAPPHTQAQPRGTVRLGGLCPCLPSTQRAVLGGGACGAGSLQEGCWCRTGEDELAWHRLHGSQQCAQARRWARCPGRLCVPPQGHVKTSLPLPRAQCLQEMAGFVFFFLLFFLNSSQKSIKISPQKTPCWSARSGTKKCKTVSQKPFKSCKKAGGVGAAGAAGTEPCPPPTPATSPRGWG